MINSRKKGFTLVELVIVIAVVAILAAVLIPTFSSLVKKANLSADQQTIRNMNTTLATYTDTEKEISDIMAYLRSNGFSYEKMVTYSKNYHYCYSKKTNMMYLLDDKAMIVYPENTDMTNDNLWAAYGDHATYMIEGVKNYYAINTISNQLEFDASFASTGYVLDLNDNVCTVNGNGNVKVQNGSITGTGFDGSEGIIKVTEANENNTKSETVDNKLKITYTNVLNPLDFESGRNDLADEISIEYSNCVFNKDTKNNNKVNKFYQNGYKTINITFKNCTFIDINGFAFVLQPGQDSLTTTSSTVIVDGCKFINCNRGIHISDWENTTVEITNSTFALKTGNSAYNCIQISCYDTDLAGLNLVFSNNTVSSANGVVYFHDGMTVPQNLDLFKDVLNFSNNKYASGIDKIADRGEYKSGHLLYNNKTAMQELEQLIK